MTNAEKYLKDGVDAEEFVKALFGICYNISEEGELNELNYKDCFMYGSGIERWLNKQTKPTLTEDERSILRNLKKDYITVGRDKAGYLFIATERDENGVRGYNALEFSRFLFQFIKERRRI